MPDIYISSTTLGLSDITYFPPFLLENSLKLETSSLCKFTPNDSYPQSLTNFHNYSPRPCKDFALNLASTDTETFSLSREHIINTISLSNQYNSSHYSFHAGFLCDISISELGKRVPGSGTGIMSKIGRFALNPIGRLARGFTPAGIVLQGAELVNQAIKEQKRIENMRETNPEAYEEYLAEQEDMMRQSAAYGGRMGFADGPEDPSKRKFMKIMGGLASLPIIGRFFDVAKEAAPVLDAVKTEVAKGKPEWFDLLVNKVIRMGENVTERFATKEREIVHQTNIGDNETVRVYQELDTGTVRVEYESPDNMGGDSIDLVYKKELPDEGNPSPSPEFYATELEPRGIRTGPDDYDVEFDGENIAENVDELMSDTGRLEYFATGKTDMKKIEKSNEKIKKVKAMNESTLEQAEYLESKYGPGPEPDEF